MGSLGRMQWGQDVWVVFVHMCVSVWSVHVCTRVYACLWVMNPPPPGRACRSAGSWVVFVCGLTLRGGGAKPEKLPTEKPPETSVSLLPPGAGWGIGQGGRFSCFSHACLGEAVPGGKHYPVSKVDSKPYRIRGLRRWLGRGGRSAWKGHLSRGDQDSLLVGFSCSLSFPVMAVGEGFPSTGASASASTSFPFPSGDLPEGPAGATDTR